LNKATVQAYKVVLQGSGISPATVNQRMSAIRKLAQEAADNGLLDQTMANGIARVKGVKQQGIRSGNWLDREQAQALINLPDANTLKGMRDRAIFSVMIGGGLRRSEVCSLQVEHIQQREGRWVIVDLTGKGNRVRTVPIPSWCKAAIDAWSQAAGIATGRLFRRVNKGDKLAGDDMTAQAVRDVVIEYSGRLGYQVAAHDLRRTFAKLAHKGGSGLDQIQMSLGHASIKTTERYLGISQDMTDAPCDRLGIQLR
jgi:integrase